ncbi:MAG: SMC-Scp complex subunit ScpB [Myxococcales bacterium]|nr:SMC-Scp complex subunit ScpB [Myxococcales bacterium]
MSGDDPELTDETDAPELPDSPELPDGDEDPPANVVPLRRAATAAPVDPHRPCPRELLVAAVEACLFAVPGVATLAQLAAALRTSEPQVTGALAALEERLQRAGAGVRLHAIGDGWQLRTESRLAPWVAAIRGGKPARLTRAANETLAIVAFRQPVTKGVLDDIRGVDSGGVLRMLADRGLVRTDGRADEPGRPLNWITTPAFLELFGLQSLADLPTLKDLRALGEDDAVSPFDDVSADEVARLAEILRPGPREI